MASSFVVYIDESGDEGFTFKSEGGSSHWFVLAAAIVRSGNDLKLVASTKEARQLLGRAHKDTIHFVKLSHGQRIAWTQMVAKMPIRFVSISIHKPSIADPEFYKSTPYQLYRYASRLLMERVSWFCRDHFDPSKGNGYADVIFSNRRRMSYDQIRDYWKRLKNAPEEKDVRIDWKHICPDSISAISHDQRAGLQIADAIASAIYQALTLDRYGNAEPRYFGELHEIRYKFKGTALGYGLKFWPSIEKLKPSIPHLKAFDGL